MRDTALEAARFVNEMQEDIEVEQYCSIPDPAVSWVWLVFVKQREKERAYIVYLEDQDLEEVDIVGAKNFGPIEWRDLK